jgi:signal peptidase I
LLPGLEDQERIFVNKFVYQLEPIERGDVVVFHYPLDVSKSYIKRVIGLPGDSIRVDHGLVILNGRPLDEPYIPPQFADDRSMGEITVPRGAYFVMGDHRSLSNDSRSFGPVPQRYVYGKAVFGYWPMDRMGVVR